MIIALAFMLLVISDFPRIAPDIPSFKPRFEEQNNRHARRRDRARARP